MSRAVQQTRTVVPLLRKSFVRRLSSDSAGNSLVRATLTSACVACQRFKMSVNTKSQMSWYSTGSGVCVSHARFLQGPDFYIAK